MNKMATSKIAHSPTDSQRLRKSGVVAKLWPNGEISFHVPRKLKEPPLSREKTTIEPSLTRSALRQMGISSAWLEAFLLGLSNVPNSDKSSESSPQYGLKGITSLGRRRVRNACHMLTRESGKHRLTFATVTVPDLSGEDMAKVHQRWNEVIENYRREMSRQLKRSGLTGEIVGVSEIQEKRYVSSGFPVLHAHFIFVGLANAGGWAITPKRHDYIWRKSIELVTGSPCCELASACNLQAVRKSCEGYLGKYMSKGASAISGVVEDGFEWALPRQWWNCSRSLSRRMDSQIRIFREGVPWLIDLAASANASVWAFYSTVSIEMPDGQSVLVGSYGRFTKEFNGKLRKILPFTR